MSELKMPAGFTIAALAISLLLGSFTPAVAASLPRGALSDPRSDGTPPTLPVTTPVSIAGQWLANALSARTSKLISLTSAVQSSKTLTSTDRTALLGELTTTTSGIAAMTSKSSADTTIAQIRSDAAAMVINFEVFDVVKPQVNAVVALDGLGGTMQQLVGNEAGLRTAIVADQLAGRNVARVQRIYGFLLSNLAAAASVISTSTSTLDALSASSYPQSIAVLARAGRSTIKATADLSEANSDIGQIVAGLANLSTAVTKHSKGLSH